MEQVTDWYKRVLSHLNSLFNALKQGWVSSALSYRFQCQLSSKPAETIDLITQRLPWRPPCHGVTRWHRSLSHLSKPTNALWSRSGTDCDSYVTSQAQQAVMLSQASAVLRPIWPFLEVRMQWLHECSVGYLTICDKCVTILPAFAVKKWLHTLIWSRDTACAKVRPVHHFLFKFLNLQTYIICIYVPERGFYLYFTALWEKYLFFFCV